MTKTCPACGGTSSRQEPGEYALMALTQGRLELNLDVAQNAAVVVRAVVCNDCRHVALYESS